MAETPSTLSPSRIALLAMAALFVAALAAPPAAANLCSGFDPGSSRGLFIDDSNGVVVYFGGPGPSGDNQWGTWEFGYSSEC